MKILSAIYRIISVPLVRIMCKTLLFGCLLAVIACTPEYLDKKEMASYIQDPSNGLSKTEEANGIKISVQYRPTDLLVEQELGNAKGVDEIEQLRNKYQDYAYFILTLEVGGKEALYKASTDQLTFSQNLQTLSFRMGDYVNITTSAQDTIPVADYIFNRTFGIGSGSSLMFVFSKEKINDKEWVSFNLNEFGMNTGDQRFRFRTKDLQAAPKLKELKISQ